MKLKCVKHDRRLTILEGTGTWVHRTGDGSSCDSQSGRIGQQMIVREQTWAEGRQLVLDVIPN